MTAYVGTALLGSLLVLGCGGSTPSESSPAEATPAEAAPESSPAEAANAETANAEAANAEAANEKQRLLASDWKSEFFPIPPPFAPEMKLVGHEEARFTEGWSDSGSEEFWTYAFAWSIEHTGPISEEFVETNLSLYFEGLMSRPDRSLAGTAKTDVAMRATKNISHAYFEGTTTFQDTRLVKGELTLNVRADARQCENASRAVVVFRFSPQPFSHHMWNALDEITALDDACSRH